MFSDNNSDKYYYNSSSISDPAFLDYLNPENDINEILSFKIFDETDMYDQSINDEKKNPPNNSSESYKNASTNPATDSIKDGPIFKITKNKKNTENSDNTDNANSTSTAKNINNTNIINNTNNTNNEYLGKKINKESKVKNRKHDKFCYDNLTRKVKPKLFCAILNCLNSSLSKKLSSKYLFLQIEQDIILNTNTIYNRELLNSTLKDIYSNKIYNKVKNYEEDNNKNLIDKIYREQIEIKTISILDKTLLQCLEHFRGSKYYEELAGLEDAYQNVIDGFISKGETNKYINKFKEFLSQYDDYYFNIKKVKPRNKKRKIEE